MATTTGIELGPDSCVMVAARPGKGATDVSAVHVIPPEEWPSHDVAVTAALRSARRQKRFPRRARVVVWGLHDIASTDDPAVHAGVRPVEDAGFRVESVLTPSQALAALAASRPRSNSSGLAAVAWLALNTHGAAIAIVRGSELLFSRSFAWTYEPGLTGSKAQLLQRYSLVSHLAPEVRRGVAAVKASHGVTVDTAVTCGDLPELRSLTMPLIEELDLEVETLDSLDGLRPQGRARGNRFAETAPGIRLAAAAAVASQGRGSAGSSDVLRAAAAIILIGALGWGAYTFRDLFRRDVAVQQMSQPRAVTPPPAAQGRPAAGRAPQQPGVPPASTASATTPKPAAPPTTDVQVNKPAAPPASSAATTGRTAPPPAAPATTKPAPPASAATNQSAPTASASTMAKPSVPASPVTSASKPALPPPSTSKPALPPPSTNKPALPPATTPAVASTTKPSAPAASPAPPVPPSAAARPPSSTSKPAPPPSPASAAAVAPNPAAPAPGGAGTVTPPGTASRPPAPAADPGRSVTRGVADSARVQRPAPLKDPLPRLDSILIDHNRRLVVIDGAIFAVGDPIGPRVVVRIEQNAIVLREPSGLDVRVPLRSREPKGT